MSNETIALQNYLDLTQQKDLEEELEYEGLPPLPAELQQKYLSSFSPVSEEADVGRIPVNLQKSYAEDFAGQTTLLKSQLPSKYSLSDLEKDPEFIIRAERFMEEIGSKEDIFEYLRDPQFSISSAVQRSVQIGNWSDQAKEDYAWLDNTFANADLKGFKETMGMIKDLSIDLVFDPVNWLAALFAAPSAGLSLSARAALNKATKEGLRRISKASLGRVKGVAQGRALEAGRKTGQYGMAEGAVYGGAHDFFLQGSEKELGLRENIDLTQTALVGSIGAGLGGILGGSIGAYTAYSPMLKTKAWNYANATGIDKSTRGTTKSPIKPDELRTAKYNEWADEELIQHGNILEGLADKGLINLQKLFPEGKLGPTPKVVLTRKTPKGLAWARYNRKGNTITINMVELEKRYAAKAWTDPKVKGVNPLPEDSFKTLEEFRDFILYHEASHSYMKKGAKESKAAYENRTNSYALKMLGRETPDTVEEKLSTIIVENTRDPLTKTKKELDTARKGGELSGGQYWLKRALLGYYGKSTSILAGAAQDSVALQGFLGRLRYDWNHTLAKGVDKVQEYTYEEGVSRLSSKWKVGLEAAIKPLLRATFKDGDTLGSRFSNVFNDVLKHDENEQLLRLLWEPNAPSVRYKDINGKLKTVYIKGKNEIADPAKEYVNSNVLIAARNIKGVTNKIADEAIDAGLITRFQVIKNYFPRQFQHDKIVANKGKFISIIANSNHANPANAYASNKYALVSEALDKNGRLKFKLRKELEEAGYKSTREKGSWNNVNEKNINLKELEELYAYSTQQNRVVTRLGIKDGGHWVDADYFEGRDFLRESMDSFKITKELSSDEILGNQISGNALIDLLGKDYDKVFVKARQLKAEAIVENMLKRREMEFMDGAYLEAMNFHKTRTQGSFKNRVFDEIPDQHVYDVDGNLMIEGFEDFVDRDVNRVLSNYTMSSARTIERARQFGKSESVFQNNFIDPIRAELDNAKYSEQERKEILDRVKLLYKRSTGLDVPTWENILNDERLGQKVTTITDWAKTSQQLAHLPLATLSSLTEPLILLSRIDNPNVLSREGYETGQVIVKSIVKGIRKDLDRTTRAIGKFKGKKTYGMKDIDDEAWREIYETGLALEQATMQRLEGLYGEAPRNAIHRGVQNAFFHANLLTQWTGAVQLAAFTTGKRLIKQNTEKLYKNKQGLIKLTDQEKKRATDRLWEAGINENEAIRWYKSSLNKAGDFDPSLAQGLQGSKKLRAKQLAFHENYYQRGAARFAKEIILVPTTAAANRPLWHSHPAGQLLAQFAGYPTAFNNTILKRFAREVYTDPIHATPKIIGTTVLMTSVATLMNAIRSQGDSLADKSAGEIVGKSIQRWGGMGPLEVAYRYKINAGYGSGQLGSLIKAPAGPLAQDVLDMILYRKGLGEMTLNNLPGSAAFQMIGGDAYKDYLTQAGRKFDKGTWGKAFGPAKKGGKAPKSRSYYSFATGGVVDIPNAIDEPDEKKDPITGLPYNQQAGILGQDEEERFGFVIGGIARRVYHGSPYRFNKFLLEHLSTGEGNQAFGKGFYFAEDKALAEHYAQRLYKAKTQALDELHTRADRGYTGKELYDYQNYQVGDETVLPIDDYPNQVITFENDPEAFIDISRSQIDHKGDDSAAFIMALDQYIMPRLAHASKNSRVSLKGILDSKGFKKEIENIQESLYEIDINVKDSQIIDWDKDILAQDKIIINKARGALANKLHSENRLNDMTADFKEAIETANKIINQDGYKGEDLLEELIHHKVPLAEGIERQDPVALSLGRKRFQQEGTTVEIRDVERQNNWLVNAGIKAIKFLDGNSRAEGKGFSNWVVNDPRLIEISKVYGVSIPAAATILYGLSQGQSAESFNRQGFAEGGVVGDDTETMSYLTRDTRKAAPYLDNKELITITPTRNLKDFSKGITQTVYRHLKEGTEIENLEDFDLSTQVGVPVHTKNDGHQAGKVRLYNPLDLRQRKIKDFQGYKFVDQLIRHKTIRQIIANNSKLPKAEAHERLKDLIGQYRSDVILVNKQQFSDPQKIEYALNVKVARDAKNILSELGYDSILYNKDGETAAMLFEAGQFRAIKGKPRIVGVTENKKYSLTDRGTGSIKREEYFLGGISKFMKQLSQKAVDVRNEWGNVLDRMVEDPEERDLFRRIIDAESRGDPNAVSKKGAKGIMQIMEATARQPGYKTTPFQGNDLFNVEENIRFGTDYMRGLKNHFGDWQTASIAYNWGPGNTREWIEQGSDFNRLPKETQKYVGKIYIQPIQITAKKR